MRAVSSPPPSSNRPPRRGGRGAPRRRDDEWANAFRTAAARGAWEVDLHVHGGEPPHPDDPFYDALTSLDDAVYWSRIDAIAARRGTAAGVVPSYDLTPPFGRRARAAAAARRGADGRRRRAVQQRDDDPLRAIPSHEFFTRLTGREAAPQVVCALPGHEERTPSLGLGPDGLWYCHGCHRGGSIYDFAAYLWAVPMPLRGPAFLDLRARLRETFGLAVEGERGGERRGGAG